MFMNYFIEICESVITVCFPIVYTISIFKEEHFAQPQHVVPLKHLPSSNMSPKTKIFLPSFENAFKYSKAAIVDVKFALYVSSIIVISFLIVTKHLPFGGKNDFNLSFIDFAFKPSVIDTAETAMQFLKMKNCVSLF